jgi:hypothetical protein
MRVAAILAVCSLAVLNVSGCSSSSKSAKAAAKATVSTTTTKSTTTTTTVSPAMKAAAQLANDKAAIRHLIEYLNTAYRVSIADGVRAEVASNYLVVVGVFTASQCVAFENTVNARLTFDQALRQDTIEPAPGWVDPDLKAVPKGRIYSYTVDVTITNAAAGVSNTAASTVHATVLPDGTAKQFTGCAPS